MRRPERWFVGNVNGLGGWFFRYLFTNQVQYARAGLNAREARRLARNSAHRHEVQVAGFAPLAAFLVRGRVDGPARAPRLDAHQVPVTERVHGVVLVGDPDAANELLAAGIHDFVIFDREVVSSVFDDDTDTWTLATEDGETCRGRIVVTCESPFVPWMPDLFGRRDFRGTAIHAAMPDTDFDPAGKRVAVIGADSIAGELIDRMASSARGQGLSARHRAGLFRGCDAPYASRAATASR